MKKEKFSTKKNAHTRPTKKKRAEVLINFFCSFLLNFRSLFFTFPADMLRDGPLFERWTETENLQNRTQRLGAMGAFYGSRANIWLVERKSWPALLRWAFKRQKFGHVVDEFIVINVFWQVVGQFAELFGCREKGENWRWLWGLW